MLPVLPRLPVLVLVRVSAIEVRSFVFVRVAVTYRTRTHCRATRKGYEYSHGTRWRGTGIGTWGCLLRG
eukprot:scaffold219198_cov50-Prasinocladus_malaysianus.AAC.1